MKADRIIMALFMASLLLLTACGQIYGNSPTGATGGGNNGYGILDSSFSYDDYLLVNLPQPPVQQEAEANPVR